MRIVYLNETLSKKSVLYLVVKHSESHGSCLLKIAISSPKQSLWMKLPDYLEVVLQRWCFLEKIRSLPVPVTTLKE